MALQAQSKGAMLKEEVDEDDIATVVAKWTGIPLTRLMEGETQKLLHMEERLKARVVGQDDAVTEVSGCIRRARSGLSDPHRPAGVFIFVGPTGVGKTELAKSLAWFLFDDEQSLIRIDMSEYMEKHSVSRLIGAPPGYVGYEEGGQLTEKVRRAPYSIVLFDEIEKAHPEVFNVLLQTLDDGRLTDGQGRVVDFRNTIIIMTSNIGSELILEAESMEAVRKDIDSLLKGHFKPEFLNRIDEIVLFERLSEAMIRSITDLRLAELIGRLAERFIALEISPEARDYIAAQGYDRRFGARPLKRAIQSLLENPLAKSLLSGEVREGDKVLAGASADGLKFTVTRPEGDDASE
jgi:ATP-dependent Clp protease ATP-binding subunit ClpB